jgi:hypothetical protein
MVTASAPSCCRRVSPSMNGAFPLSLTQMSVPQKRTPCAALLASARPWPCVWSIHGPQRNDRSTDTHNRYRRPRTPFHCTTTRRTGRPAVDVEIVVPVYNEQDDLGPSVRRLHAYLQTSFPFSATITIADNASTDGTWDCACELARELPAFNAVHLDAKGRGRALHQVWAASSARVVAYMDAYALSTAGTPETGSIPSAGPSSGDAGGFNGSAPEPMDRAFPRRPLKRRAFARTTMFLPRSQQRWLRYP